MTGALLVAALTLLPWHAGRTAIQSGWGVGAAVVAVVAVAWLAVAVLTPRPLVADPGRGLLVLWAVALVLVTVNLVTDRDGLRVGAWTSGVLAVALVGMAARRRPSAS